MRTIPSSSWVRTGSWIAVSCVLAQGQPYGGHQGTNTSQRYTDNSSGGNSDYGEELMRGLPQTEVIPPQLRALLDRWVRGQVGIFQSLPGKTTEEKLAQFIPIFTGEAKAVGREFAQFLQDHVPGDTLEQKLAALKTIYDHIQGVTPQEKLRVVRKMLELSQSAGTEPLGYGERERYEALLQDYYPLLQALAGTDGYIDHGDVAPSVHSLLTNASIDRLVLTYLPMSSLPHKMLLENLFRSNRFGIRQIVRRRVQEMADKQAIPWLNQWLDSWGVKSGREGDDDPAFRDYLTFDHMKALAEHQIDIPAQVRGLSRRSGSGTGHFSLPPEIKKWQDQIRLPHGLPVRAFEDSIYQEKIPTALRFSLDGRGRLVIQ